MLSDGGHDVTVKWPIEWRSEPGAEVLRGLEQEGLRLWPGGQAVVPSPFGLGGLKARFEVWQPGIVLRFKDGLPPTFVAWHALSGTPGNFLDLLVRASHPRRFSPYHYPGAEWIFTGREAEIALLTSSLPGLQVAADFGMGKTSLLRRAAGRLGSTVISCQGFGFADLASYLQRILASGGMPQVLFLDEMDALLLDRRTLALLFSLNDRGILWRIAVHQQVSGVGPIIKLGSPRGMGKILSPLTSISGKQVEREAEGLLLQGALGNPRRLMNMCKLVVDEMGENSRHVDAVLVAKALQKLVERRNSVQRVI